MLQNNAAAGRIMKATPSTRKRVFWIVLLATICAVALWVPLYNRLEPSIAGIPFFYWFQFCWIMFSSVVTALAYKAGI